MGILNAKLEVMTNLVRTKLFKVNSNIINQ